jgi:hypothetical protein
LRLLTFECLHAATPSSARSDSSQASPESQPVSNLTELSSVVVMIFSFDSMDSDVVTASSGLSLSLVVGDKLLPWLGAVVLEIDCRFESVLSSVR